MLRDFVESRHYKFAQSASDWREAIRMSCESLEADGTVDETYKEEIIACLEKYGPYIVIMPNVALPHSQEGAKGVNKTAIGFMKLEEPISFEEGDSHLDNEYSILMLFTELSLHLTLYLIETEPKPVLSSR